MFYVELQMMYVRPAYNYKGLLSPVQNYKGCKQVLCIIIKDVIRPTQNDKGCK
jgi:hypothetical protein